MSFIQEVGVFGDLVFRTLQLLVVSASRHMLEHLFRFVCESRWEVSLLDLAFYLAPLRALNSLLDAVGAGTGTVLLGDDPSRARFRLRFDHVGCIGLRLGPLQVRIVVFSGWHLHCEPLLVLSEVNSSVLASYSIK